jgi:hypothetical protein
LKLKIKLPLLFLLMLVTLAFLLVVIRVCTMDKLFPGYKDYADDNKIIADRVAAIYPDQQEIAAYLQQISTSQNISLKLYNHDASAVLLAYLKPYDEYDDKALKNFWLPVKTPQHHRGH